MKNKKFNLSVIVFFIFIFTTFLFGENGEVVLDESFFKDFNRIQVIQRDDILDVLSGKIVIGRGKITAINSNVRYKKKYRIIIESTDASLYNQKIVFFVFLENKNTVDLLTVDSSFEFKGQFMGYTPLGTKRNEYIFDVILMDGSTVIE